MVGLHHILAGNVITCLEPLLNCQCSFKFRKKYSSEINIKKVQKQDLKNIKNVKGRDGMPKSMQTR